MTSAQFLQPGRLPIRFRRTIIVSLLMVGLLMSCETQKLQSPDFLKAPYRTAQLWAVAPFNNESGSSLVETYRIADLFTEQVQQVEGLNALPVNRVIVAMRQLELESITTPEDAGTLLRLLGVDGLIVGTISSYDAYPPPKMGVALQLYHRNEDGSYSDLDPRALTKAPTDDPPMHFVSIQTPQAQAAGVFDASNHQTLMWLEQYTTGRTEPDSAFGDEAYLVSMELFTEFVSYRLIHDLLEFEQHRIQPSETQEPVR
ncbi:MAG: hypothetical protein O7G85_02530 [Planctomycetota bacterium]|nr:hypothetical protein [Planctomycetota bacterium]